MASNCCVDAITISSCILQITCNGQIVNEFLLSEMRIIDKADGRILLCDEKSARTLTQDEFTLLGLTRAQLETTRQSCLNGGASTGGLAENAIIACDPADNNIKFIVEVTYDDVTDTFIYVRTDGTPVVEGVDFVICTDNPAGFEIKTICACDVAANGSVTATYVRAFAQSTDGTALGTNSIPLGDFTDESLDTHYTVLGTSADCSTVGSETIEIVRQCMVDDTLGDGSVVVPYVRYQALAYDGTIETVGIFNESLDAVYTPVGTISEALCPERHVNTGYIRICDTFDLTLSLIQDVTVSADNVGGTNTLTLSNTGIVNVLVSEIKRAQEYANEQAIRGLTITDFQLQLDTTDVLTFDPRSFTGTSGVIVQIDQNGVTNWTTAGDYRIEDIAYTVFSNCDCETVEMVQDIKSDGTVELISIIKPQGTNFNTNIKEEITLPLELGIVGPFPGPCPADDQVLGIRNLCCNNDLVTGQPDIANLMITWLDGSDSGVMLDAIGGNPIAGNEGDQVFEVESKINPGVNPSFELPTTGHPANPPTFTLNAQNGLSGLSFAGANQNIIDLDISPRPVGSPYTIFKLFKTDQGGVVNGDTGILSVTETGHNGGGTDSGIGYSYQITTFGTDPLGNAGVPLVIRIGFTGGTPTYNILTGFLTAGDNNFYIASAEEFTDNTGHLVTINFEDDRLGIYFDGQLRLDLEFAVSAPFRGELFRFGVNLFGTPNYSDFTELETLVSSNILDDAQVSIINAYLICKWGVDPSLVSGTLGALEVQREDTFYSSTPFVEITKADGTIVYRNTENGLEYSNIPVPGLAFCDNTRCGECDTSSTLTTISQAVTADFTIPSGTREYSIQITAGTVDINGNTMPTGWSIQKPFLGKGDDDNLYGQVDLTNVTGTVLVSYTQ